MTRIYTTGEKPANPIIRDDIVREITDVREEPAIKESQGVKSWSYELVAEYTKAEYIKRLQEQLEAETNANLDNAEVIAEILAAVYGGA